MKLTHPVGDLLLESSYLKAEVQEAGWQCDRKGYEHIDNDSKERVLAKLAARQDGFPSSVARIHEKQVAAAWAGEISGQRQLKEKPDFPQLGQTRHRRHSISGAVDEQIRPFSQGSLNRRSTRTCSNDLPVGFQKSSSAASLLPGLGPIIDKVAGSKSDCSTDAGDASRRLSRAVSQGSVSPSFQKHPRRLPAWLDDSSTSPGRPVLDAICSDALSRTSPTNASRSPAVAQPYSPQSLDRLFGQPLSIPPLQLARRRSLDGLAPKLSGNQRLEEPVESSSMSPVAQNGRRHSIGGGFGAVPRAFNVDAGTRSMYRTRLMRIIDRVEERLDGDSIEIVASEHYNVLQSAVKQASDASVEDGLIATGEALLTKLGPVYKNQFAASLLAEIHRTAGCQGSE